jgi:hypothetical protein
MRELSSRPVPGIFPLWGILVTRMAYGSRILPPRGILVTIPEPTKIYFVIASDPVGGAWQSHYYNQIASATPRNDKNN